MAAEQKGTSYATRRQFNQRIETLLGEWQATMDRGGGRRSKGYVWTPPAKS